MSETARKFLQAIQVPDLRVQFVVSLRADRDNTVGANHPDVGRHLKNAAVGDFLAVPDIQEGQIALCAGVDEDSGDDQRTKIVSFAGFIDADAFYGLVMRLVRHRRMALVENIGGAR